MNPLHRIITKIRGRNRIPGLVTITIPARHLDTIALALEDRVARLASRGVLDGPAVVATNLARHHLQIIRDELRDI